MYSSFDVLISFCSWCLDFAHSSFLIFVFIFVMIIWFVFTQMCHMGGFFSCEGSLFIHSRSLILCSFWLSSSS
jgi:hypothetical protein